MQTVNDITIILYNIHDTQNDIVQKFISIPSIKKLSYNDEQDLYEKMQDIQNNGYSSKEVLILKKFMGRFFQKCPGSPVVICCNYYVLNTCFNCLYDCTYCFLNQYLNSFGIVQFTNLDEFYTIFEKNLSSNPAEPNILRVGPGEFTDTLMFDEITDISKNLIDISSNYNHVMLELKTKSNNIQHLLDIKNKGNTVISWTLSTQRNIDLYEKGTANLSQRIEAAKLAVTSGYIVALHFDPIIMYDQWEKDYNEMFDMIFTHIPGDKIAWISMGVFRYTPGFKEVLRNKFPEEMITVEEMFPGVDGKFRYLKSKRIEIYRFIKKRVHEVTRTPFLYMCMESSDVWYSVFGRNYSCSEDLERDFSNHLKLNILNM